MPRKKTSTKAAGSKKSLKNLSQTHGKQDKFAPTPLDQVWGESGLNKYGTMDEEAYNNYLDTLTRVDLQMHASEVGIVPVDNRERLEKTLLGEFRKHVSAYTKPATSDSEIKTRKDLDKTARQILDEGR